jgi:hypothetical protein
VGFVFVELTSESIATDNIINCVVFTRITVHKRALCLQADIIVMFHYKACLMLRFYYFCKRIIT